MGRGSRKRLEINRLVAEKLSQYADLLEIKGENPYKVRAYRMAAHSILSLDEPLSELTDEELLDLDGVGKSILRKIRDIERVGTFKEYEDIIREYPLELLDLKGIPGLSPRIIKTLYENFGVTRLEEVEGMARRGELLAVPGIGPKTVSKILKGIEDRRLRGEYRPLWLAWDLAWELEELLKSYNLVSNLSVAGSTRRMVYRVRNLDLVSSLKENVSLEDLKRVIDEEMISFSRFLHTSRWGEGWLISFETAKAVTVNLYVVPDKLFYNALIALTGSRKHLAKLSALGEAQRVVITDVAVIRDGEPIKLTSEEEFYHLLGLQYIPPEMREDRGEVELARDKAIPRLVELSDIKGDLHIHSYYSDGANSIYEIAQRAISMGYEYVAIADHSQTLKVADGLSPETLSTQWEEIERVSQKLNFRILKGSEVDILPDGSLDYDDEILSQLDVVIGSVHSKFSMPEREMTERIKRALNNPYLHVLGHPTGRLIGVRESYALNLREVIDEAIKNGKLMEINSNPNRLDLWDEPLIHLRERGGKVVINTDAHSLNQMAYMFFGVGQARRAWLTPEMVINTYPYEKLLKTLREIRAHSKV